VTSPCSPTGCLAAPVTRPSTCHCGARIVPVPRGDDWLWADEHGQTYVSNRLAVEAEWGKIRDEMHALAADRTPKTRAERDDETPAINRYSVLSAQLGLGWVDLGHQHDPADMGAVGGGTLSPPPWCHREPMQAVPAGWRCRVARVVAGYDDLIGAVQVQAA